MGLSVPLVTYFLLGLLVVGTLSACRGRDEGIGPGAGAAGGASGSGGRGGRPGSGGRGGSGMPGASMSGGGAPGGGGVPTDAVADWPADRLAEDMAGDGTTDGP